MRQMTSTRTLPKQRREPKCDTKRHETQPDSPEKDARESGTLGNEGRDSILTTWTRIKVATAEARKLQYVLLRWKRCNRASPRPTIPRQVLDFDNRGGFDILTLPHVKNDAWSTKCLSKMRHGTLFPMIRRPFSTSGDLFGVNFTRLGCCCRQLQPNWAPKLCLPQDILDGRWVGKLHTPSHAHARSGIATLRARFSPLPEQKREVCLSLFSLCHAPCVNSKRSACRPSARVGGTGGMCGVWRCLGWVVVVVDVVLFFFQKNNLCKRS